MFQPLDAIDLVVIGGFILAVVAIGVAFMRPQGVHGFCLGGQTLSGWQIGLSLSATLITAVSLVRSVGESYELGLQTILVAPTAFCLLAPLAMKIGWEFRDAGYLSIYEYYGHVFDSQTQRWATGWFVLWRFIWLVVILQGCGAVMQAAAGIDGTEWGMVLVLGLSATLYTFLGGLRAVVWTDFLQYGVIALGIILLVSILLMRIDNGAAGAAEVLIAKGRTRLDWSFSSSFWLQLGGLLCTLIPFYTVDQVAGQRYLAARSASHARNGAGWHAFIAASAFLGISIVGLLLFVFYQQNADRLITASFNDGAMAAASGLENEQVSLTTQYKGKPGSSADVLPRFIAHELPPGIKGLVLAAIMAAAMSTIDAGLSSLATALFVEFRFGRWRRAHPDPEDDLRLCKALVVVVSVAATGCSLLLMQWPAAVPMVEFVAMVSSVPLLTLWLLARLSPVRNRRSARVAFITATVMVAGLFMANLFSLHAERIAWPFEMHILWIVPIATFSSVFAGLLMIPFLRNPAPKPLPDNPILPSNGP